MPLFPTAPVRIQPYFGYRSRARLIVTARALRSRENSFETAGNWRAFRTMLAQFASHEVEELPVELEIARPGGVGQRHQGITDKEGFVTFDIRLDPAWDYGAHPAWESVLFHWTNRDGAQCVTGHVLAPGRDTQLAVVSDIDDTIVETGITGNLRAVLRNWRRVLVEMPEQRVLVPGADVFYGALGGGSLLLPGEEQAGERKQAPHRPFFYVSSSPWSLFSYLVAYLRVRGLPLGPLMLRDWGLNRATFASGSHGAHKREAIDLILSIYPEMAFALVGDDSQGDLIAFAEVVQHYPKRVRAIFIRKVGEAMSAEEVAARSAIEAAGVPLWMDAGYATGHAFLASLGLAGEEEAAAVMEAVSAPDGGAEVMQAAG